jgi:hypothetical protein
VRKDKDGVVGAKECLVKISGGNQRRAALLPSFYYHGADFTDVALLFFKFLVDVPLGAIELKRLV